MLALPDRHGRLDHVDGVVARRKRSLAVGGGDSDHDAWLADLQRPHAVHDGDCRHVFTRLQSCCDRAHLALGHLDVDLVIDARHGVAVAGVADAADEHCHCPVAVPAKGHEGVDVDGRCNNGHVHGHRAWDGA